MIRRLILAASISLATLSAGATEADPAKRAAIEATVAQINQNAKIAWIKPAPIPGLSEVSVDGVILYISDDGKYLLHGTMLDVANRKNLTELAGAETRRELLASIKDSDKIIYSPAGTPKHKVVVFTDISCGYCHRVHENIQAYLALGIQVEYVAFPRGGPQSPVLAQMEQIWCAKDRRAAYDAAIKGQAPIGSPACDSPIQAQYELGDRLGVEGTPAIYTYDGLQHGGFVPPDQLVKALDSRRAPGQPDAEDDTAQNVDTSEQKSLQKTADRKSVEKTAARHAATKAVGTQG